MTGFSERNLGVPRVAQRARLSDRLLCRGWARAHATSRDDDRFDDVAGRLVHGAYLTGVLDMRGENDG